MSRLSKSRFIAGQQCLLRLWNEVYQRDLATPFSDTQLAFLDRGTAIGELAQARYPGGVLVGFKPWERDEAVAETQRLMADPLVPAIYEAACEHEGVFVRVDVLVRCGDAWELVEVKASTRPEKAVFQQDAAVQYWVLTGAGLDIVRVGVLVLDRDYVYPGGDYDLERLFRFGDATEFAIEQFELVGAQVREFHAMLAARHPPDVAPGDHCFSPYECRFWACCTQGMSFPDFPIEQLPRLQQARREQLQAMGIDSIVDVPDDFPLNGLQSRVREAVRSGQPWQSPELGDVLRTVDQPVGFLDFEAFQPALPPWPGMRPFDSAPFMFSLHVRDRDGRTVHKDYLYEEDGDCRRAVAEALLAATQGVGSLVVYSSYERTMINQLIAWLPDLATQLALVRDRLWDLLPVVRNHYYHPDFAGSFSIKAVLPVLVPDAGWSDLDIADGLAAAISYEQARAMAPGRQRQAIFQSLRDYCCQDTLAMVRLLDRLIELSS